MRTQWVLAATVMAASLCAGCNVDFPRQLIEYDTSGGKLLLSLTGTDQQLLHEKRIDYHHRFLMKDTTFIDVWILRARPEEGRPIRGTALLLHGLGESKARYLGAGQRLAKMGYDVVLPDLRAHGHSGGKYVTYGALEKRDIQDVMDKLLAAGTVNPNVYVFGATLGAATAIQYAAIEPRVKAVLALTPYKDAPSIARRNISLIAPTMSDEEFASVLERAGEIAGFDPAEASTVVAATKVTCPLLLVHGMLDLAVPLEHSQAIYQAAAGPKKLVVVTPGPEQVALAVALEAWIAQRLDRLATGGVDDESPAAAPPAPTTQPAPEAAPTTMPAPAAAPTTIPAPTTRPKEPGASSR